jgi:ATP-dependent helicase Lhr and Lhr-like helicase
VAISSPPSSSDQSSAGFDRLSEPVRRWIWQKDWKELRDIQEQAIPAILDTEADVIIAAATAGGKTEAAFLPIISRVADASGRGFKAIYISPLKALINDQFRRLDELCELAELPVYRWHGDVSAGTKARARRSPNGIVLITPESLEALFVRRGVEVAGLFSSLEFVVIDELHAFIGQERGKQLQSLLHRLDLVAGRLVRRVGLSATLGDMALAAEFMRPGAGEDVIVLESGSGGATVHLQVRGYEREEKKAGAAADAENDVLVYMRQISDHIFDTLRGTNGLVFAGSRANVEAYADLLRQACEKMGVPEEFFAHHANLTRSHREFVEERLKEGKLPTSAVCTSTLELGIDIGAVENVAQIGAPWSVASLRQRLGRSGRRDDKPAVIRLYVPERQLSDDLHPADRLRCQLVQTIAMVRLLAKRWCEPPRIGALHLSTLAQQMLALISQYGGITAARAHEVLCKRGPFGAVSPDVFIGILQALGDQENRLIEQSPDGTLLLGEVGERIVDHYDFYAVFQSPDEFRIVYEEKELGTLPILTVLVPGMTIIFSGRRWQVVEVRDREKVVLVSPSKAGVPPMFGGEGGDLHDVIAAQMREVYMDTELPTFLDEIGARLLVEAREEFDRLGLRRSGVIEIEDDTFLFPWAGSVSTGTLALALKGAGLEVSTRGVILEVDRTPADRVIEALRRFEGAPAPDAVYLAMTVGNLIQEKYDPYLPHELLAIGYASDRMRPETVPVLARRLLTQAEDQI